MAVSERRSPVGNDLDTWPAYGPGTTPKWERLADWDAEDRDADGISAPYPPDATKFSTFFVQPLDAWNANHHIVRVLLHVRLGYTSNATSVQLYPRVQHATRGHVDLPALSLPAAPGAASTILWLERAIDISSWRPGAGTWSDADFGPGTGACSYGCAASYNDGGAFQPVGVALQVEVLHQPVGVLLPGVRRAASTAAWSLRTPDTRARVVVPATFGDVALGSDLWVSDTLAPALDGRGWGVDLDALEPRPLWCIGVEDDLAAHTLTLTGWPLRGRVVSLLDSGRSRGAAAAPDGVIQLAPAGVTHTFERSSPAWLALADGLIGEVPADVPAIGPAGRLHEGRAVNEAWWSAFQEGGSWVLAGGAAVAVGAPPLFAPGIQGRVIDTPAGGTAVSADCTIRQGTNVLSFEVAGHATVRLYRPVTGLYWNATTAAWEASPIDNPLGTAATRERRVMRVTLTGKASAPLTLTLGAAAGQSARWWHVQCEVSRAGTGWASSHIVARGAVAAREHTWLMTADAGADRCLTPRDGTARLRWQPMFSAADVAGAARAFVLWRCTWDADSYELAYLAATGTLRFRALITGEDYVVTLPISPVAGQVHTLAAAWQSDAQHGLPPGTIRVGCDGQVARFTLPVPLPDPAEIVAGELTRGGASNSDGDQAEGLLWGEVYEPFSLSDAELWEE